MQMTWLETVVLGVIQGLTEMLPISSSGHLRLASALFFDADAGASFTAVTQLGTEAAVLLYFAKDIWRLAKAWVVGIWDKPTRQTTDYRMGWYVIIGTIPIVVLGLLFKDAIRDQARNLWLVAASLILFGLLLGAAERFGGKQRGFDDFRLKDGLLLGVAQAGALIPGVSRSGATITAGLFLNIDRAVAARYSFLLAIPAVLGSGLYSLPDVFEPAGAGLIPSGAQMIVATVIAFLVGLAAVHWMLRWVERHSVYIFVWYRVIVGVLIMILLSTGVIDAT
ncbi:undecaprenyl-diphosphatase [Stackebrandtia endophytica]|uniref:Undecaprenyl-diphosphatase n=2 Tax=Stackebrandtia endophytica TaxID=1496996 RepID=A0A543AZX8_9ACTN|nr:undecaprenyl-diphosphatase [Stackebrandtia endophytica]